MQIDLQKFCELQNLLTKDTSYDDVKTFIRNNKHFTNELMKEMGKNPMEFMFCPVLYLFAYIESVQHSYIFLIFAMFKLDPKEFQFIRDLFIKTTKNGAYDIIKTCIDNDRFTINKIGYNTSLMCAMTYLIDNYSSEEEFCAYVKSLFTNYFLKIYKQHGEKNCSRFNLEKCYHEVIENEFIKNDSMREYLYENTSYIKTYKAEYYLSKIRQGYQYQETHKVLVQFLIEHDFEFESKQDIFNMYVKQNDLEMVQYLNEHNFEGNTNCVDLLINNLENITYDIKPLLQYLYDLDNDYNFENIKSIIRNKYIPNATCNDLFRNQIHRNKKYLKDLIEFSKSLVPQSSDSKTIENLESHFISFIEELRNQIKEALKEELKEELREEIKEELIEEFDLLKPLKNGFICPQVDGNDIANIIDNNKKNAQKCQNAKQVNQLFTKTDSKTIQKQIANQIANQKFNNTMMNWAMKGTKINGLSHKFGYKNDGYLEQNISDINDDNNDNDYNDDVIIESDNESDNEDNEDNEEEENKDNLIEDSLTFGLKLAQKSLQNQNDYDSNSDSNSDSNYDSNSDNDYVTIYEPDIHYETKKDSVLIKRK